MPTRYEYSNGNLTQIVDTTSAGITYPVLADPNWTYSLAYTIGESTTASAIWNELHRCFNCSFPVNGTPAAFPSVGQVLPLTVGGLGNFTVLMEDAWYTATHDDAGFLLSAEPGHIDGVGSAVSFEFIRRYTDNKMIMMVSAFVVNDFALGNSVYLAFARDNWGLFASNLINNLGLPIPPEDPPTPGS